MPTLGRGLTQGGGTPALLTPAGSGVAAAVASSLFFGPELTATIDARTAVRLDVYWPGVRTATITRYDYDGTSSPVRNAEPLQLLTQAVVYDHEAPLDRTCTYRLSSVEADGVTLDSDPVYVSSAGRSWLKHPFKSYLSRAVHLQTMPSRNLPARRGIAVPIDRADPIVVHQLRVNDEGTFTIQTDGTWQENDALRALLADGAPLLLQQTGVLGEGNLYMSVDTVGLALPNEKQGTSWRRNLTLPFIEIARPPGMAAGPIGITYASVASTFLTYEHIPALEATYNDLATMPGL